MEIVKIVIAVVQIAMVPIGGYIIIIIQRAYRRSRLVEYKLTALIFAVQKKLADNGFTDDYENKLKTLLKDYEFINK